MSQMRKLLSGSRTSMLVLRYSKYFHGAGCFDRS
jgi:hypothetical protein